MGLFLLRNYSSRTYGFGTSDLCLSPSSATFQVADLQHVTSVRQVSASSSVTWWFTVAASSSCISEVRSYMCSA